MDKAEQRSGWAKIRRTGETLSLALLVLALGGAFGDWAVWKLRGAPQESVIVTHMVVAPLKGNRAEYFPGEQGAMFCSKSALPWNGLDACWWRRRHQIVLDR